MVLVLKAVFDLSLPYTFILALLKNVQACKIESAQSFIEASYLSYLHFYFNLNLPSSLSMSGHHMMQMSNDPSICSHLIFFPLQQEPSFMLFTFCYLYIDEKFYHSIVIIDGCSNARQS
ncbi:hypothetical protein VPH35_024102 [Triticum aestivum]